MELALRDKVVWITGAAGGIGRAIAEAFATEGAQLALQGNRSLEDLHAWVDEQPWKDRTLLLKADVRDSSALERCAGDIRERFGRIDICAANAGRWPPGDHPLDELPVERLRDTIEVNLLGALLTARAFLGALRQTGPRPDGHGAALVFTGSTAARFGERDHTDYAASKAGLVGAVRSLKNEIVRIDPYGRVNLVEPGWTVTHMARQALEVPGAVERATRTMALRQLARAQDIARTICWLSSPTAASHLTGQVLTVAGGMEGRLLWDEADVDREAILARLDRD